MARLKKIGIVLFNLGGPDGPDAIKPFLFNLFNDPDIIRLPQPIRWGVAKLISHRRAPTARIIYDEIGGGSPIVAETQAQVRALENYLHQSSPDISWKASIAMRYWHPFSGEAARELLDFDPDQIILLPLYPQYSGTTTASSVKDWKKAAKTAGLDVPTRQICCYPEFPDFIRAHCALIAKGLDEAWKKVGPNQRLRLLLSAHGLPKRVIDAGDPYAHQVEKTAFAIKQGLGTALDNVETVVCYQSRVGPLEWIGPPTDGEIRRAADAGAGIVIAPIAFVSEHAETLVELDIEYAKLARDMGAPCYIRTPTPGIEPDFIRALGSLVEKAAGSDQMILDNAWISGGGCGTAFKDCPLRDAPSTL